MQEKVTQKTRNTIHSQHTSDTASAIKASRLLWSTATACSKARIAIRKRKANGLQGTEKQTNELTKEEVT
jgi:hypothetical protein